MSPFDSLQMLNFPPIHKGTSVGMSWNPSEETKIPEDRFDERMREIADGYTRGILREQKKHGFNESLIMNTIKNRGIKFTNKMKKFKYPLAIAGTGDGQEELISELKKLGYKNYSPLAMRRTDRAIELVTDFSGSVGCLGYSYINYDLQRYRVDIRNIGLILALAAMVDEDKFYEGEYVVLTNNWNRIEPSYYTVGGLYRLHKLGEQTQRFYTSNDNTGDYTETHNGNSSYHFRKATKEEIIEHFNNKNMKTPLTGPQSSTVEVSIDFVKEAHEAACSTWKEKIENAVPSLFPKTFYRIGQRFEHKSTGEIFMIVGGSRQGQNLALIAKASNGEIVSDSRQVSDVNKITQKELELMFNDRGINISNIIFSH